ncbi:MAG: GNAT family N-acetyltransferase [Bacteroides sp.]|nr:GNAT family N-acetyltransferase [Eubacterium sp.]MCM1417533.1 GNAT family N-acetyltransferase [Roseburia sp.]MCM1463163.1 GNAT family N-acetyltransferase [Bacteroides sp.]
MEIRFAEERDIPGLDRLLLQVLTVHHNRRPDLFKGNCRKYTDDELRGIIRDPERPILVAADEGGEVMGYAFCVLQHHPNDNILTDIKTLYIDDLCVDEVLRGKRVGTALYEAALDLARKRGCYNVTLNVWSCNEAATRFYEKCGLKPQKVGMEKIL